MRISRKLARLLLCAVLELGAVCGVPMSPDEIEELMRMNEPKVVCVMREADGDPPPEEE